MPSESIARPATPDKFDQSPPEFNMTSSTEKTAPEPPDRRDSAAEPTPALISALPQNAAPDGGMRGWFAITGSFLILFSTIGFINSFGVFQEYYVTHELSNESDFDVSWLGAVNIFVLFAGGVPIGILNDRFGPQPLLWTGAVLNLFSLCMISLCESYYQFFLAQGILLAISIALLFNPAMAAIPRYFTARRALASGIVIGGSSVGGVVWPIAMTRLLNTPKLGFPWTMRIVALINLPCFIIGVLAINPPKASSQGKRNTDVKKLLKDVRFIFLGFGMFLVYLGLFSPFFFIAPFATKSIPGISSDLAFYLISITNATSLFGRVLPGFWADKYGRFNGLVLAAALSGIVCLCWLGVFNTAGAIFFALAYGFVSGSVLSLQFVCVTMLVGSESAGIAVGLLSGALSIGGLFGTAISGQLWGQYGLTALSVFSGLVLILGACSAAVARFKLKEQLFVAI